MGEKRTFECIWGCDGQGYMTELAIDVDICDVTGQFPEEAFQEKIAGKRVRVTVEEIAESGPQGD